MTEQSNALVPSGGRGTLANIGNKPGTKSVSFEKHALLLLNKEVGRYLVGLYMGPRSIEVKKYINEKNPAGATLFEEFAVIETNAPSAGNEPVQKGDTVTVMGGGQLSSDLRKGKVQGRFLKVEFLGKQSGQLKDGTFAAALNKYRILDVDEEMRRLGFGGAIDASPAPEALEGPSGEELPPPPEEPPF